MKKTLISILFIMLSCHGFSQIAKGGNTFGLNLFVLSSSSKESDAAYKNSNTNLSINPHFGYLITDKLELGLGVAYSHEKNKYEDSSVPTITESSQSVFSFIPYLKCYNPISEKFYFNVTLAPNIGFGSSRQVNTNGSNTNKTEASITQFGVSITPAFSYLFNNHWAVDLGIGSLFFESTKSKDKETDVKNTSTNFILNGSFAGSLSVGCTYYF